MSAPLSTVEHRKTYNNQPPSVAFPVLPALPQLPEQVAPDIWLKSVNGRVYRRRVNSDGTIQIDRHTYSIGARYTGKLVLVHVDANRQALYVTLDGQVVKSHPVQGLYGRALPFWDYFKLIQAEAQTIELHRLASWARMGDSD